MKKKRSSLWPCPIFFLSHFSLVLSLVSSKREKNKRRLFLIHFLLLVSSQCFVSLHIMSSTNDVLQAVRDTVAGAQVRAKRERNLNLRFFLFIDRRRHLEKGKKKSSAQRRKRKKKKRNIPFSLFRCWVLFSSPCSCSVSSGISQRRLATIECPELAQCCLSCACFC